MSGGETPDMVLVTERNRDVTAVNQIFKSFGDAIVIVMSGMVESAIDNLLSHEIVLMIYFHAQEGCHGHEQPAA